MLNISFRVVPLFYGGINHGVIGGAAMERTSVFTFILLLSAIIAQPAFSNVTLNQTLGIGDALDIPFTTPSGGLGSHENSSILSLEIELVPTVVSTNYLTANLFVGNTLLNSNPGFLASQSPVIELFAWGNQNSAFPWDSFVTPIDFSLLLSGTNQGLIQVLLASSNPVTIETVTLLYGVTTDGGPTISVAPEGFTYSASITPVPEPSTMILIGSGLIGFAGYYGRKKFFKK